MGDQKKESKALPKQSLITGVVNSIQKNLAAPQQVQNPTTQRTSAPTLSVVAPNYSKSHEPQRRDFPAGPQGNTQYNRTWLAYNRSRPVNHPTMVFDGDTIKNGLGTGWAGWSSAVWNTPGLQDLNAKYHIYDPGSHQTEAGYRASLALGTGGRDMLMAAVGGKYAGLASSLIPVQRNPPMSLLGWWNQGINTKVPPKDWFAYEVGQNTLGNEDYQKYGATQDAVARGRALIKDKKLLGNVINAFRSKGPGRTLLTGPTPGSRFGMRALGAAGLLASEYYGNQQMWDEGWDDAVKSLR